MNTATQYHLSRWTRLRHQSRSIRLFTQSLKETLTDIGTKAFTILRGSFLYFGTRSVPILVLVELKLSVIKSLISHHIE